MRKLMTILFLAAAVGTVWAEEDDKDKGKPEPIAAPAPKAAALSCEPPVCTHKVCCPEPTKTKKTTVYYECKSKDLCFPKCPKFTLHKQHDCDCNTCEHEPNCGKPRTVKRLVKKVIVEEKDTFKCVPREVITEPAPCCKPGHHLIGDAAPAPEAPSLTAAPEIQPVGAVELPR